MDESIYDEDGISFVQEYRLIKALVKAGMTKYTAKEIIQKPEIASKIIHLVESGGFEETSSQRLAREIMGENFIGVGEIQAHLGYVFHWRQLKKLSMIPFSSTVLEEFKNTHVLFPSLSMTLAELVHRFIHAALISISTDELSKEKCAQVRRGVRWHLIDKVPVTFKRSDNSYNAQVSFFSEIPTAYEIVLLLIIWELVKDGPLWKGLPILTRDITTSGEKVYISTDDQSGCIYPFSQKWHHTDLCSIALSRKIFL